MSNENNLGPLSQLVGQWYGNSGKDCFPGPPGMGSIISEYTELMNFIPIAPVQNGPQQTLYGVQFTTVLTGAKYLQQQHQESGYYLWDPNNKTIINTFAIPRGEALMASGGVIPWSGGNVSLPSSFTDTSAGKQAKELFDQAQATPGEGKNGEVIFLSASADSKSYGILNTPYLDENFDITEFALILTLNTVAQQQVSPYDPQQMTTVPRLQLNYYEVSALKYTQRDALEYHTDTNTLWKQV